MDRTRRTQVQHRGGRRSGLITRIAEPFGARWAIFSLSFARNADHDLAQPSSNLTSFDLRPGGGCHLNIVIPDHMLTRHSVFIRPSRTEPQRCWAQVECST